MLIKLAKVRVRGLSDAVAKAQEAGRKYVTIASQVLAGNSAAFRRAGVLAGK